MGNTPAKTDTTADLLDEVARGLRLLRERLEEGKARWSMALVETRRPFDGWRWDRDAKEVGRSGEWVSWLDSPVEVALASETEWVVEVVNPNSISRSEGMPSTLAIHSGAVDRFTTERTDPSVAQYLRDEVGDGVGFVLAVPFAGPVMDGAAWSLWAGGVGPPGPTMTYDRQHIAEREALRFDHNGVGGVVFVGVGPLRITPPDSAAWTLAVGLRFDGEPPTADQAEGLWDHLDEVLVAAGWDRLERESRSRLETADTPSSVTIKRFINNAPSKLDPSMAALSHALRTQSLPIDSSAMRPWDALVEEEVARLQRDIGDSAFHRIPGVSQALLKVVTKGGKRSVTLTKDGERELIDREGRKGFRRYYGDFEFLVKRVRVAGTDKVVDVRLSWHRAADLISRDHRNRRAQQLKGEEAEDEASLIKSPSAERARRYRDLQLLGSCEDASALLLLCISKYGADPKSGLQLRIPRWEIAGVLGINDHDSNGLQRIEAALRLLQEMRFGVASDENGGISGEGVVVSDWLLEGSNRIPGFRGNPHADIDATFTIGLSAGAVGTLAAYFNGGAPKHPRFIESTTLAPWVVGAAGFTATQSHLWEWVRRNLTRMKDHSTLGAPVAHDTTPREYGETFCPLIPKGRTYYAALGRFRFRPEAGFTLKRAIIKEVGYDPPKGKSKTVALALADLNAVVVETFGGMVVGRTETRWVSLVELRAMAARTAEAIPLFIFVPKDYAKREVEVVETHQRGRKDRGETKVDVRVAESAEAYSEAMAPTTKDVVFRGEVVEHRKRLGLTQTELGSIIGVGQTQLSRWEMGGRGLRIEAKERLVEWLREAKATPPTTI